MYSMRETTVPETKITVVQPRKAALSGLVRAVMAMVDESLPKARVSTQVLTRVLTRILAACRYGMFSSTGDAALAEAARASDVLNRTPPPGRPRRLALAK